MRGLLCERQGHFTAKVSAQTGQRHVAIARSRFDGRACCIIVTRSERIKLKEPAYDLSKN